MDCTEGPPRPPSVLVIHYRDSQNSEKLLHLRLWFVTAKRFQEQSPGETKWQLPVTVAAVTQTELNPPAMACDSTRAVLPTGRRTLALVPGVLIRSQLCRHEALTDWPQRISLPSPRIWDSVTQSHRWAKRGAQHKSHCLHTLSGMACGHYTKALLSARTFQGLRGSLPGAYQTLVLKTFGICRSQAPMPAAWTV